MTVLASFVLASIGLPLTQSSMGPLAVAQARRPRPIEDVVLETALSAPKLGRSVSVGPGTSTARRARPPVSDPIGTPRRKPRPSAINTTTLETPPSPFAVSRADVAKRTSHRHSLAIMSNSEGFSSSSSSLPIQHKMSSAAANHPMSPGVPRRPSEMLKGHAHLARIDLPSALSDGQKIRLLRQNYFRSQTQLLHALEDLSSRLVSVPKAARLSALRAELAMIAQDLPAEVDIPSLCPATLIDGSASKSRHHRIVRLNPAEATSLNSAAKVPYLLMLEVLREDFDFDPHSESNVRLLSKMASEKGKTRRRLFDTSDAARAAAAQADRGQEHSDSVMEPTNGDLSSPALLVEDHASAASPGLRSLKDPPRLSSGVSTLSSRASVQTPRTSEGRSSGPGTPGLQSSSYAKQPNQADVSALADHMRMASQMLSQLDLSGTKRPKTEVAAIKAKIIASMQALEEQSFLNDDTMVEPSFDAILAKVDANATLTTPDELADDAVCAPTDPDINTGKGAARMENDAMTGGIQRKGDRDDPSAATFGEAWEQKKERIRRSSPYGLAKNWDLISVIVKTGDDLRQEAFACQLIGVCSKVWDEHGVDVWVKNISILVTGESSGLIETITNAVSLHSLKRSLTIASINAGTNPRKRIATLQDHFTKTFGATDSPAYLKAIDCFAKSLAAYSIISYILQLKDRHNGNILIDSDGHAIHIDFGFMLSNSPGGMNFEAAPFKMTFEYVELLGGVESAAFLKFKELLKDAFQALRREAERVVTLVELMGKESKMACYGAGLPTVISALRARFVLEKSKEVAREYVEDLITKSVGSYYTRLYDTFQYRTQGIY